MEMENTFLAGAGKAVIPLRELPMKDFSEIHDDLHIRVVIMEGEIRIALLSVEITSVFPDVENRLREIVAETVGIETENVWVTLTHSFGGPHMWPSAPPGKENERGPWSFVRSDEEKKQNELLKQAHFTAAREAAEQAVKNIRPATVGSGLGRCTINASRNILTDEGWWVGTNCKEPCDQSLPVLSIQDMDGKQIAILFEYGIRSCVVSGVKDENGRGYITSDLAGVASSLLEEEYGDGMVAFFLCGACGDQEPALKGSYDEQDKDGNIHRVNLGTGVFSILEAQGRCLASEVMRVNREIATRNEAPRMRTGRKPYVCKTMKRMRPEPMKHLEFTSDGEKTMTVHALCVDDFNLVGVQPEINGVTAVQITEAIPDSTTAVAVMVNGCDKCMPEEEAYKQVKYQSMNANVMPGSAEIMRDTAISLVTTLRQD